MKKISIFGHELAVTFNMAVQIEFEELSGKAFSIDNLETQKATMQLCYASLKVANDNVPFTFDEMTANISVEQTAELKNAVFTSMSEWFVIPEVIEQKEEEDGSKN